MRRSLPAPRPPRCTASFVLLLGALLFDALPLRAQAGEAPPAGDTAWASVTRGADLAGEDPEVVTLAFRGVQSVDTEDLEATLETRATRCRSFFYVPICWFSSAPTWVATFHADLRQIERDVLRIRVFYFRRGWRDTRARAEVTEEGDGARVTFVVDEGPVTRVREVRVRQVDSVLDPSGIRRAGLPREGEPLDLNRLDSARVRLRSLLWDRAYADARVRDTTRVDDAAHEAVVEVTLEPGSRTTVDTVDVRGNRGVTDRTVRRLLDLRGGQLYQRGDVLEAQRRLYRSELFRQVLVQVPEQADSAKRVVVSVREAPFHALEAAVGFNTTEFGQVQGGYTLYNWMGGARRVDLRAAVGNLGAPQLYGHSIFGSAVPDGIGTDVESAYLAPTWQLSANLSLPWLFSTREALSVGAFAHRRSVPGIVVDRGRGGSASLSRRLGNRIPATFTYRFEETAVEAGDVYFCANFGVCRATAIAALSSPRSLSPLTLAAHADRADDPLEPTSGYTARVELEHASDLTLSDFHYERLAASFATYLDAGRGTLALRARVGRVWPRSSTNASVDLPPDGGDGEGPLLHPRKRFYAGGAGSVRGYGENQLGPRILTVDPARLLASGDTSGGAAPCTTATLASGTCDPSFVPSGEFQPRPVGGRSVLEASVEYRFPVTPSIKLAAFVDAARVGGPGGSAGVGRHSAITPGFGMRYLSPVGPIRVDLGIRPTLAEDLAVITQVTDPDGTRRLVRLDATKHYDPVETSGSFLRQVFSRLQLHLAIGEAF